jgi:hypothetical protein
MIQESTFRLIDHEIYFKLNYFTIKRYNPDDWAGLKSSQ